MKAIMWKLLWFGFLMFAGGTGACAAETYEDGMDVIGFFGDLRPNYEGTVTAMERAADGTTNVRIHAEEQYYQNGPYSWDRRKVSKECLLHWTQTEKPVPFATG